MAKSKCGQNTDERLKNMLLNLLDITSDVPRKRLLSKELRRLMSGERGELEYKFKLKDFKSIQEKVLEGLNDEKLNEMIGKLPDFAVDDVLVRVTDTYGSIKENVPVNEKVDLFGINTQGIPSLDEQGKFIRGMRVVYDPFHVFDLMREEMLTNVEVGALKQYYPGLYEKFVGELVKYITEHPKLKISRALNNQLGIMLGVNYVTPEVVARLQGDFKKAEGGSGVGEVEGMDKAVQTPIQALDAPS